MAPAVPVANSESDGQSRPETNAPSSESLTRNRPTPVPKPPQFPKWRTREPGSSGEPSNIPEPTPVIQPMNRPSVVEVPIPDSEQLAPPVLPGTVRTKHPHPPTTSSNADREAEELAAEVAAILAEDAGEARRQNADPRAPRPLIVKLPSEKYLTEATRELQSLPMDERPAAFQAMIEKYRAMRAAERESMRKR